MAAFASRSAEFATPCRLLDGYFGAKVALARNLVGILVIVARAAMVPHECEVFAGDLKIGLDGHGLDVLAASFAVRLIGA